MHITLSVQVAHENGSVVGVSQGYTDPKPNEIAETIIRLLAQVPSETRRETLYALNHLIKIVEETS